MLRIIFIFCLLVLNLIPGNSQIIHAIPESLKSKELDSLYYNYSIFSLDKQAIKAQLTGKKNSTELISLHIQSDSFDWDMELEEFQIFSTNFITSISTLKGIERIKGKPNIHVFRGHLKNEPYNEVAVCISDNFLNFAVRTPVDFIILESLTGSAQKLYSQYQIYYHSNSENDPGQNYCSEFNSSYADKYSPEESADITVDTGKNCLEIKIAMATDFSAYTGYNKQSNLLLSRITSNLNAVQLLYDDEFDNNINFLFTEAFIVTDSLTDPWIVDNSFSHHLLLFSNWAQKGGFSSEFDLATAWTNRNIEPGIAGRAYMPGICTSNKYNACSFTNSIKVQAHEIGHNLNAGHDTQSGYIMAQGGGYNNKWSDASLKAINEYIKKNNCLQECIIFPPKALFEVNPSFYCLPNVNINFTDKSIGVRRSWYWEFPGGTPSFSFNQNPRVSYSKPGKYSVLQKVTNRLGVDSIRLDSIIIVDTVPNPSFSETIADLTAVFQNNGTNYDHSYFWRFGDGSSSREINPTHKYKKDGIYDIILQEKSFCGTKELKHKIEIRTVDFKVDTTYACAPYTIQFSNLSASKNTQLFWNFPGGNPSTSISKNPVITYLHSGKYSVTLIATDGQDTVSLTRKSYITIDTLPIANFQNSITDLSVFFTNQSTYGLNYFWDFGDGQTSTEKDPQHSYINGGTYIVTLRVGNNCGYTESQNQFRVGPLISRFTSQNQKICVHESIQFINKSWNATSYFWSFSGGNPSSSSEKSPIVIYEKAGTYDVKLVADDGITTDTYTAQSYISVDEHVTANFDYNIQQLKVFFFNNSKSGKIWFWDFGDGKFSTQENPSHRYSNEGVYKVKLTVTNDCESITFERTVIVFLVPIVNFTSDKFQICYGEKIQFKDLSSSDVTDWFWEFEDGNPKTSTLQNPLISYNKAGSFTVKLTVKNSNGSNNLTKVNFIEVLSPILCPLKKKNPKKQSESIMKINSRSDYDHMTIIPNPNFGNFQIEGLPNAAEKTILNIYDLMGRNIYSESTFDQSVKINLDGIVNGTYVLIVDTKSSRSVNRFVVSQ